MIAILAGLAVLELVTLTFALALCRAAALRPLYGPPLTPANTNEGTQR